MNIKKNTRWIFIVILFASVVIGCAPQIPIPPTLTASLEPGILAITRAPTREVVLIASGEWHAATDFGELVLTVDGTNSSNAKIKKVSYRFSDWSCGSVMHSGELVDATGWTIAENEFAITSSSSPDGIPTIVVDGMYDAGHRLFSGTWKEIANDTVCSGTWEASVVTH